MKSGDITGVTGVPELTWCYNRNICGDFQSGCDNHLHQATIVMSMVARH